ncbi:aminotransferase class I/II-fold pyridoxal phosphate-dependent enzyme [Alicycliphilus denitrificans]|uniref:aminotransferase class I/II-fold pyridoxal phosphate-dependent enzyme n=1 Tax=Alicycliphilus denitrificans TaxID=179636 RepID=UPI0001F69704|nr:aminotransferase class I/II-fold pyridoxal phosphate-dependent enzyme [Alicycliphilus denitrificans]ADV00967.1 aminotransferase class I and II [Alicycliphilus denitrificans BC]
MSDPALLHGGPDALGAAPYDFSTNANACGPCPAALDALRQADRSRYPDPAYTALHARLAAFHGVPAPRIVLAASASEFIHRITAFAARGGLRHAVLPAHGYGDYARAAAAWGLARADAAGQPALHWACEPASPLGTADEALARWALQPARQGDVRVIDRAYAPLRLEGAAAAPPVDAWQLWSPNKALGLTGVRAAYAIAPGEAQAAAVQALAPSWPLGADGVALLQAWTGDAAQAWLAASLATLRAWKAAQVALCASLGWAVLPGSLANFFTARPPAGDLPGALQALRAQGIKLRDCASFGLSGHVRLGVLTPPAQQALAAAWRQCVA